MNAGALIDSLERFGRALPELVRGINSEDARWKPADGAWSILEIVRHLADEEELDFRARVRSVLETPEAALSPIDPEGWAVERNYNAGDLDAAVARFVSLRNESVAWLRSLDAPAWSNAHQHPRIGPMRAGDFFAAWVAHDCLHLRQIAKRMYQMAARDGGEFSVRYAGDWND